MCAKGLIGTCSCLAPGTLRISRSSSLTKKQIKRRGGSTAVKLGQEDRCNIRKCQSRSICGFEMASRLCNLWSRSIFLAIVCRALKFDLKKNIACYRILCVFLRAFCVPTLTHLSTQTNSRPTLHKGTCNFGLLRHFCPAEKDLHSDFVQLSTILYLLV